MIKVNVRLERRRDRDDVKKSVNYDYQHAKGLTFPGEWEDAQAHANFRAHVQGLYPGWTVVSYVCLR